MSDNNRLQRVSFVGRAFFAKLQTPERDEEYDKERWTIDVVLTDTNGNGIVVTNKKTGEKENMLEKAEELNVRLREASNSVPGPFIKARRATVTKKGVESEPPKVSFKDGTDCTEMLGNESLVQVTALLVPYKDRELKREVNALYLTSVKVLDLVPYYGESGDEFDYPDNVAVGTRTDAVTKAVNKNKKEAENSDLSLDEEDDLEV